MSPAVRKGCGKPPLLSRQGHNVQEPESHEGWSLCTDQFTPAMIFHARKAI